MPSCPHVEQRLASSGQRYWPGSEANLQIIDPAYRKMYDDILMSGSRRFVVTFTRSLPGGRVRYADMEEHTPSGHVKYRAKHEVKGRVQLLRLLNPSALFETDAKGNKASAFQVNYLRAEIRILPEEAGGGKLRNGCRVQGPELLDLWQDFQSLAQKFEEPYIAPDFFTKVAPRVDSGILAAAWQQVQVQTMEVRRQKRATWRRLDDGGHGSNGSWWSRWINIRWQEINDPWQGQKQPALMTDYHH
eukprot:Skav220238  [mRNA]  locus=scaffold4245:98970:102877:- [translate_table: standard]